MTVLMCCSGAWARNMKGDVFLFEGDSLAQLNEDQCEVLDYALYLLEENDSVVLLPMEFNTMMGDTTDVKYVGHVDFKSAYFRNYGKSKENTFIRIPVYTETSYGVINSSFYVNKEDGKCTHYVCTQMPKNTIYKETSLFSNVDGEFKFVKVFKNGKKTSKKHQEERSKQKYHERNKNSNKNKLEYQKYRDLYDVPRPYTALEIASGYPQKFLPKSGL